MNSELLLNLTHHSFLSVLNPAFEVQRRCVAVLKEYCYENESSANYLPTTEVFPLLFTVLKHHHSQPTVVLQVFGLFVNLMGPPRIEFEAFLMMWFFFQSRCIKLRSCCLCTFMDNSDRKEHLQEGAFFFASSDHLGSLL